MQKKAQGLDFLLKRVSKNISKSPDDLQPFFNILKSNWYESEQDLLKLGIEDYEKMKIPHRVAQGIMQQLKGGSKPNVHPKVNNGGRQVQTKKAKEPLNQMTMQSMVLRLSQKLLSKLRENKFETRSTLEIIYKLIANIVKDPYELKFRTLKKSNNLIQQNIVQHEPCLEFVKQIGFEDLGQTLQLKIFEVAHLIFLEDCLCQAVVDLGGANLNKPMKVEQNMFLNVKKFPGSENQVKQHFSQQRLSQMKYVDALEKLIQIRNKMMSEAPKDRRVRIYHKRFQSKQIHTQQMSFEEQFAKSNDQEVIGYWKQIMANNARSQKFQSKRKLQFEYLIKQKIHKETLIKIKLPNQLIIQGYFGPMEKLSQVFKLVARIVIGDLYLFTAPPKKIMDKKELDKTLIELDSVPQGSFYLGTTDDIFYIQKQYESYIQR